mmetsp:Transcript_34681/g.68000  ORF Transcript_34681/g.68000 Transcript_34681/m.68000 type:complete len:221 (-) Transcript_34681:57-719(-)
MSTSSSSSSPAAGSCSNATGRCESSAMGAERGSAGPAADSSASMSSAGSEKASSPAILEAVSTSSTCEAKTSLAGGWALARIMALAPFWLLPPPSFWLLFCLLADLELVMSPSAFLRMGVAPCICLLADAPPPELPPSPKDLPGARCWTMCWFSTSAGITRSPSIVSPFCPSPPSLQSRNLCLLSARQQPAARPQCVMSFRQTIQRPGPKLPRGFSAWWS